MKKKTEYRFNKEITRKIKNFGAYLHEKGNARATTTQKTNHAGYYLKWLEGECLHIEGTGYNDIINFMDYCHSQEQSARQIGRLVAAAREYYQYLKKNGHPQLINPALTIYLKGAQRKLPGETIAYNQLEKVYADYPESSDREKRNKAMLGLVIYQGVDVDGLTRLEPTHIKLKEGKIHIPGNRKRNSRILGLKPFQVLSLHEYMTQARPRIMSGIKNQHAANHPHLQEYLFIGIKGSDNTESILHHMFQAIHKKFPEIKNTRQIRSSVITHWLKNFNLRQVQYMAGHKYVSSTIRYQLNNLEGLQEKLKKLHPLQQAE